MIKKKYLMLLVWSLCLPLSIEAGAASIQLRGSTTLLPIAQRVAEAYMSEHPEAEVVVSGGGTERGYKAILDGTADIGMASGIVPETIADQLEQHDIKINTTVVDYDAIVAVVHPSNPVNDITIKQLKNIFSGRIKNWKEVGGVDAPIDVFVGIPTGGITDTWKRIILGEEETYTPAGVALATEERLQQVMAEPMSITYITMGTLNNKNVKILNIEGISVNKKTVVDGNYALRVPLMLITTNKVSADVNNFIQYFLAAPKASMIGYEGKNSAINLLGKAHE